MSRKSITSKEIGIVVNGKHIPFVDGVEIDFAGPKSEVTGVAVDIAVLFESSTLPVLMLIQETLQKEIKKRAGEL